MKLFLVKMNNFSSHEQFIVTRISGRYAPFILTVRVIIRVMVRVTVRLTIGVMVRVNTQSSGSLKEKNFGGIAFVLNTSLIFCTAE